MRGVVMGHEHERLLSPGVPRPRQHVRGRPFRQYPPQQVGAAVDVVGYQGGGCCGEGCGGAASPAAGEPGDGGRRRREAGRLPEASDRLLALEHRLESPLGEHPREHT